MEYDVIIVGSGPAGTTTGYHLARAGFKVLMLEKEKLPRYKPCAGALALRVLDIIDFDVSPALEKAVHSIYFTHKLKRGHLITAPSPLCYMVMRDRFDHLLAEKAIEAGTEVIQESKVTDVNIHSRGVVVSAGDRQYRGQIVVGADGSKSAVARSLGLYSTRRLVVTIQSEVFVEPSVMDKNGSRIWVDIGSVPSGYAWLFPKSDHLSMGIGVLQSKARGLKRLFWQCLKGMLPSYRFIRIYTHSLSIWGGRRKIAGNRAVLVGDAAGLTDPLTGEGIYYAIQSGIIAARVISQCLSESNYDMSAYESAINSEIGGSLQAAMILSAFFYAFPRLTHRSGLCNNRITTYFSEMMQSFKRKNYKGFCAHALMGL